MQTISWINEHKNVGRVSILVLMLVAFLGPWVFDLIDVPAKYTCSPPYIRLEGYFCGVPLSGIRMFAEIIGEFINMVVGLITGKVELTHRGFEFMLSLYSLFVFLLVLPIINTILFILRGDRRRQQIFHMVVCGLDLGVGLLLGVSRYPQQLFYAWGIWLYIVLTISALILEALALVADGG